MTNRAHLVLEDGSVFAGQGFGAEAEAHGEVVFTTSMTGYQEALTDPSFAGQILSMTFPLQGNYGVNRFDTESRRVQVRGFVVREACDLPSHWRSEGTLHDYLASAGIPAIEGVDTRALTRRLRSAGVMMGAITREEPEQALARLREAPRYEGSDFVREVSASEPFTWRGRGPRIKHNVVVLDLGVKHNILRILRGLGCRATAVPASTSAGEILSLRPDGVVLSPGRMDEAPGLVTDMLDRAGEYAGRARQCRKKWMFNVGHSGRRGAEILVELAESHDHAAAGTATGTKGPP